MYFVVTFLQLHNFSTLSHSKVLLVAMEISAFDGANLWLAKYVIPVLVHLYGFKFPIQN